ncbi:MAG: TetR family transcriptional regulator [Pseudonocardiales bacterium]|nr:TetR family transcriptional regulator [Pseudonocardiales bacterium]
MFHTSDVTTADSPEVSRRYDSTRRRQTAATTRFEVIAAATRLFVENGWSGTSMRDVARAAGVAVETVYAAVGPKPALLEVAVDVSVVGDDEPVPLADRPEFQALGKGTVKQRAGAAGKLLATLNARTAGLHRVLQHAALSEPALAELLRKVHASERESTALGIRAVAGRKPTDTEIDGLQAVLSNDVYLLLTGMSGWSDQQYQTWVADTILRLLDNPKGQR